MQVHSASNNISNPNKTNTVNGLKSIALDTKLKENEMRNVTNAQGITDQTTIKNALESFNKIFKPTHIEFKLHDDSGRCFAEIIDNDTKQVLKQIPSEEFLEMIAEAKAHHGLIIDQHI
jgi:flagellar protein FlaG